MSIQEGWTLTFIEVALQCELHRENNFLARSTINVSTSSDSPFECGKPPCVLYMAPQHRLMPARLLVSQLGARQDSQNLDQFILPCFTSSFAKSLDPRIPHRLYRILSNSHRDVRFIGKDGWGFMDTYIPARRSHHGYFGLYRDYGDNQLPFSDMASNACRDVHTPLYCRYKENRDHISRRKNERGCRTGKENER